jgi:hypothetical protein
MPQAHLGVAADQLVREMASPGMFGCPQPVQSPAGFDSTLTQEQGKKKKKKKKKRKKKKKKKKKKKIKKIKKNKKKNKKKKK